MKVNIGMWRVCEDGQRFSCLHGAHTDVINYTRLYVYGYLYIEMERGLTRGPGRRGRCNVDLLAKVCGATDDFMAMSSRLAADVCTIRSPPFLPLSLPTFSRRFPPFHSHCLPGGVWSLEQRLSINSYGLWRGGSWHSFRLGLEKSKEGGNGRRRGH